MTSATGLVAVTALLSGLAGCGDGWSKTVGPEVEVRNRSSDAVTIVYLVGAVQTGDREVRVDEVQTIATVEAGEEHVFVPGPANGDCLVAPLVAQTEGGDEVARLPTGTCFGEPIDFVIGD